MGRLAALLATRSSCKLRDVASVVGHLLSMSYSFGALSVLMTRSLAQWLAALQREGRSLNARAPLSPDAVAEIEFWQGSFTESDGRKPLWRPPLPAHAPAVH